MAIFLDENSKVIVQGMTGSEGMKHTQRMLASGTNVVGGVNPRKAGTTVDFDGGVSVPVFGTVAEAMRQTGADVSVIFVPPPFAKDAVVEAIDAQIPLAVVITEGIPVHDSAAFWATTRQGQGDPHHRPELPRPDQPREVQRRHHPGQHHRRRPDRPGLQVGHADLPDDVRAARLRLLDRASASAATRSSAPRTSTASRRSRTTPTPTRS